MPKDRNRLWITRIRTGMSRKRLAMMLGQRSTSQICRWERGEQIPTLENALMLSHVLQLPVEFLFRGLRQRVVTEVEERLQRKEEEAVIPTL